MFVLVFGYCRVLGWVNSDVMPCSSFILFYLVNLVGWVLVIWVVYIVWWCCFGCLRFMVVIGFGGLFVRLFGVLKWDV